MSRMLRLFACAAGMLALAVIACLILRDDEISEAGSHVVSGRLVGVQSGAAPEGENAISRAAPVTEERASVPVVQSEERTGAARVKVLELARAAAERRELREAAPAEAPAAVPAASPVPSAAPGAKADRVETEALALLMGQEAAAPETKPAAPQKAAPAAEAEKPEPKKAQPEKAQPKKAEVRKPKAEKPVRRKPEPRKAESAKPRLSAVEAALADARAGRLAPDEAVLLEDDPSRVYDRVVTSARFSMKGSLIKLTLRGNSPMIGHFYVLEDPDRVVLDLAGNWKVELPRVPSNRLIRAVRVGQHDDKTRLVFDMKTAGKAALVPLNRNALELRIK